MKIYYLIRLYFIGFINKKIKKWLLIGSLLPFCFSAFWLTNETINIWSHVFGWMLFFGLTIYDLFLLNIHASQFDKLVVGLLLGCFQVFTTRILLNINLVLKNISLDRRFCYDHCKLSNKVMFSTYIYRVTE